MAVKLKIKRTLSSLGLDLTQNMAYDRLTLKIMDGYLQSDSCCVDVGSHEGDVLEEMLRLAPNGKHYAFEPIPLFYEQLCKKFEHKALVFPYALGNNAGLSVFQYVRNAPAYSGLRRRKYDTENPDIEEIQVEVSTLDNVIPQNDRIDFIKIDVEGAEYDVIYGGKNVIARCKPLIVFEFGLGGSDYYETQPEEMFALLQEQLNYGVNTLKGYLKGSLPLTMERFCSLYNKSLEYYFIAHPL